MSRFAKADAQRLEHWIKYKAFALNPLAPDPGRVTLRRLNRVEYRNTVRDLLGVEYRADEEFPADDTGHGFDNIGDVLSVSPLLLEKYLAAAQQVVAEAVPMVPKVVRRALRRRATLPPRGRLVRPAAATASGRCRSTSRARWPPRSTSSSPARTGWCSS